ncbi:endonuclease III domain-containing protein [Sphaerochaeta globosa]|uniref:Endonuclease III n=1 Tax=Sphaerochaeta globosa (strain ATCC BAA-1886 / DSM 22777 / Buddy) TaxID=158189 RepID=F0RZI7_SPHGB|nr:endonuclease III [Sphaerochaeta globosa]ADY13539.1 DNA-(apurinic or apyrimidinic site) lyase [Sphaerochaeta globosa str. Buddy]
MNKKQRMQEIFSTLDTLLPQTIQFLEQRDPFRFLISVILSAQTTDRIVNVVAKELFAKYPDKQTLAQASSEDVESIIYPTGYYRNKAKHIIACSEALLDCDLPDTMEELVKLPGVGRKTASCVLGDIYGKCAIIVDTHFSRVVNRLGLVDTKDPEKVEKQIAVLLDDPKQYRFSMTANLFGRTVCHAKKPECENCPLSSLCPSRDAFLKARSKG